MAENGPRNVFLHLLTVLCLYISAIGAAVAIWGLADFWFPDPTDRYWTRDGIRTGVSMLVVAFPLFLFLSRKTQQMMSSGQLKARSTLARVMTYVTLFLIAVTSIVDLITIIYNFLGGDLTARFAVKGFGILAVTGLIFAYYLGELRSLKEAPA
jgi:hypothetical protein